MHRYTIHCLLELLILIFSVFLLVALPQFVDDELMFPTQTGKFFLFSAIILLLTSLLGMYLFNFSTRKIALTKLDIALGIYFLYQLIRVKYFSGTYFYEFIGLGLFYLSIRIVSARYYKYLLFSIIIAVVAQGIYGLLQLYGIQHAHHSLFNITGSFFNPGPYAGYLVSALPISVGFFIYSKFVQIKNTSKADSKLIEKVKPITKQIGLSISKYLSGATVFILLLVIPITESRASWLAVIVSLSYLAYVLCREYKSNRSFNFIWQQKLKRFSGTIFQKMIWGIASFLIIASIGIGLYKFKEGSANGRILIWKASAEMIREKPILGHGFDSFQSIYMKYQGRYFKNNNNNLNEINLVDDNKYAFNEFIKLQAELGFIGLSLLLIVLYLLLVPKTKVDTSYPDKICIYASKAGVIGIIVFGCFSYPGEILPIKMNSILYIAVLSKLNSSAIAFPIISKLKFPVNRANTLFPEIAISATSIILLLSPLLYISLTKFYSAHKDFKTAYSVYMTGNYPASLPDFKKALPYLNTEDEFIISYGKALSMAGQHQDAINFFSNNKIRITGYTQMIALGDSYKALKQYKDAEDAYKIAANMIPNRLYPRSLLAKLYLEQGMVSLSLKTAKEVINQKMKVFTNDGKKIKNEMQQIVEKHKYKQLK